MISTIRISRNRLQSRKSFWLTPMLRALFIGVGQGKKKTFRIWTSCDLQTCRQIAIGESHRYGDGRKSRSGNKTLGVIAFVLFICLIKRGGRVAPAWKDEGINPGPVHGLNHGCQQSLPSRMVSKLGAWLVSLSRMNDLRLFLGDCVQNTFGIRTILSRIHYFHDVVHRRIITERK